MADRPSLVHDELATELNGATRDAARQLLLDAFSRGKHAQDNAPLVNRLFGFTSGTPHCHQRCALPRAR